MKVLFSGVFKDGTGWGNAAEQYILALDAVDIDVVPRAIKLNQHQSPMHPHIAELEKKSEQGCDVHIQCILPDFMDYSGYFKKNIGMIFTETSNFCQTRWATQLNLMDETWVTDNDSVWHCRQSKVDKSIAVIPVPCDVGKYSKRYEKLQIPQLKDKFVFYFIGEYTRRKNLSALLKAYYGEFTQRDNVILLIKTHVSGMSQIDCERQVNEMCEDIKKQLRIYRALGNYPSEIVMTQHLSADQIMQIHATGDCFVMPSFGEGWCIPAFDAMAMGKTPICTHTGGMADFIHNPKKHGGDAGWLVRCEEEPCFGMQMWSGHDRLYTGTEEWCGIDVLELRTYMRKVYSDKTERERRAGLGIDRAYDFTHEEVGKLMDDTLNGRSDNISNRTSKIKDKHNILKLIGI